MSELVRVGVSDAYRERHDREHRAQPGRAGPQRRRGLGRAVPKRRGRIQRLDRPRDRATGERVGLVVAGHQHRGVGLRAELEGEVAVGVDDQVVVAQNRDDAVRPCAGRRFVVGGHREVHAVTAIARDAVAPGGVDRAHVVDGVGVVPAPAAVRPERRVELQPPRPGGIGEQVGVERHAESGGDHAISVRHVTVVAHRFGSGHERIVESAKGVEEFSPRDSHLAGGAGFGVGAHGLIPFVIRRAVRSVHVSSRSAPRVSRARKVIPATASARSAAVMPGRMSPRCAAAST